MQQRLKSTPRFARAEIVATEPLRRPSMSCDRRFEIRFSIFRLPGRSHVRVFARHRRVKDVTSTRLTNACVRCYFHVARKRDLLELLSGSAMPPAMIMARSLSR